MDWWLWDTGGGRGGPDGLVEGLRGRLERGCRLEIVFENRD